MHVYVIEVLTCSLEAFAKFSPCPGPHFLQREGTQKDLSLEGGEKRQRGIYIFTLGCSRQNLLT